MAWPLRRASISLRLPLDLLERIKIAANKRDVPYQSLIKVWLAEKVSAEEEQRLTGEPGRAGSSVAPRLLSLLMLDAVRESAR